MSETLKTIIDHTRLGIQNIDVHWDKYVPVLTVINILLFTFSQLADRWTNGSRKLKKAVRPYAEDFGDDFGQ